MKYFKLAVCLLAAAMMGACSERGQDTADQASQQPAATAQTSPMKVKADDGGIPLSAPDKATMSAYKKVRKLADSGDFIQANQAARMLTEKAPEFAGGWIMLGNTALSGEQFVKATTKAVETAASGTKGEQIWADINMTFVTNDAAGRLKLGKGLVDAYPESARASIVYSGVLAGQNKVDDARAAAVNAIKLAPKYANSHVNLGFLYLYNAPKDFAKAEEHFRHAIDLEPGEDNHWVNVGDVHRAMGNLDAARGDYSKAWELNDTNSIAVVKRAHVNSFLGNYDEARADYNKGIDVGQESNQSTLANYRAFVHLHAGNPEAAVAELKQELKRIDSISMPADQKVASRNFILVNLSDITFNNDMMSEAAMAVDHLAESLAESGRNSGSEDFARQQKANAKYWQAKLAIRQGDYATGQALADEFAALLADDDNPRKMERYHELQGLSALMQKNYDEAVAQYRQANLSTSPGNGDVKNIYMLARSLQGTAMADEADELLNQVANWNFNSVWFAMLRKEAAES